MASKAQTTINHVNAMVLVLERIVRANELFPPPEVPPGDDAETLVRHAMRVGQKLGLSQAAEMARVGLDNG